MSDAEYKTYRAKAEGFDGDKIRLEGETFTTNIPKGSWMAELDADGNEIEEEDHSPLDGDDLLDAVGIDVAVADEVAALREQLAAANKKIAAFEKATGGKADAKPAGGKKAAGGKAPADPLDHDKDGKKGGVANSNPVSNDEKRNLLEGLTDEELRKFVADKAKAEPAEDATREQLLEAALAD